MGATLCYQGGSSEKMASLIRPRSASLRHLYGYITANDVLSDVGEHSADQSPEKQCCKLEERPQKPRSGGSVFARSPQAYHFLHGGDSLLLPRLAGHLQTG